MEYLFKQMTHNYYPWTDAAYLILSSSYISHIPNSNSKHKLEYKVGTNLHRTDGPAIYTWDDKTTGITKAYYVDGVAIRDEAFECILSCPENELPLLINTPVIKQIAIDRLKGAYSTIALEPYYDRDLIEQVLKTTSPVPQVPISIKDLPYNLTDPKNFHWYLNGHFN